MNTAAKATLLVPVETVDATDNHLRFEDFVRRRVLNPNRIAVGVFLSPRGKNKRNEVDQASRIPILSVSGQQIVFSSSPEYHIPITQRGVASHS